MYREAGPPVNDGEREVLRLLRDQLGDEWFVLGNFEFPAGSRWYECDALAISPSGWAYLIETKQPDQAVAYLDRALQAPPRAGRQVADSGRREEARVLLTPIYGWFSEGLETPDLRAAAALLER